MNNKKILRPEELMLYCFCYLEDDMHLDKRHFVTKLDPNYILVDEMYNSKSRNFLAIELNDEMLMFLTDNKPSEVVLDNELTHHFIDTNGFDVIKHVNGEYTLINSRIEVPIKYLHELQIQTQNKYGKLQKLVTEKKRKYGLIKEQIG